MAGVVGLGNTVASALIRRRPLGRADVLLLLVGGVLLAALAALAIEYPRSIAVPFAVLAGWAAVGVLARAYRIRHAD